MSDRPTVLLGETRSSHILADLRDLGWGRMFTERPPTPYEGEPWGFDNGAWVAYVRGEDFPADTFLRRLEIAQAAGRPLLAVCPDIVGGGLRSMDFSLQWLDRLPQDWPWYLAVQDGTGVDDAAFLTDRFSGIFLGGTTAYKSTARAWATFAHGNGLRFHYGRAGTPAKLLHALEVGADSLDSAFPLWTRERFEWFAQVWRQGHDGQLRLPLGGAQ